MKTWTFKVPGKATAKGSVRAASIPVKDSPKCPECDVHGKHRAIVFKEKATDNYENLVKMAAFHAGVEMCECVALDILLAIPCRVKEYKTKANILLRPSHPDLDNLNKAVQDGLQGIAYKNDRLVDSPHPKMYYLEPGAQPYVEVTIRECDWRDFLSAGAIAYEKNEEEKFSGKATNSTFQFTPDDPK